MSCVKDRTIAIALVNKTANWKCIRIWDWLYRYERSERKEA